MKIFLLYIGHGRALELFLGFYKIVLFLFLAFSSISFKIPALSDLSWHYSDYVIAAPFGFIGTLQLVGLYFNAKGYELSWIPRFVAAVMATLMWSSVLIKSGGIGEPSLMIPMALACLPANAFLLYKSWNRLPIPGAVGLV